MEKTKRVFVFGNGTTLACQEKGEENFRNTIKWGITLAKQNKNSKNKNIKELSEHIINFYDDFKMIFYQLFKEDIKNKRFLSIVNIYNKDIDTCIKESSLNDIIEYLYNRSYKNSEFYTIEEVIKQGIVSDSLIDIFYKLQISITKLFCLLHNKKTNYYDGFVKLLKRKDIVINLNWDNLFENSYRKVNKKEPNHIFLKNNFKFINNKQIDNKFFLLKPHGSIEYGICQTYANQSISGCFRITAKPNLALKFLYNSQKKKKCAFCNKKNITNVFVQPYTRIERAIYSQPFVQMSIEASKKFIKQSEKYEFTFIGYSFAEDNKGWIDYDLLPIFIRAKKINIVAYGEEEANDIKKRIENIKVLKNKEIVALKYKGFGDYIKQSQQKGKLL